MFVKLHCKDLESDGIIYSPRRNPIDSAILILVLLAPHFIGKCQEHISSTLAILSCHSPPSTASVSLISGASMLTVVVATPSSPRLPSIL